ncbi:hypothetical protein [Salipaludibacillus keqinensis]|uniref:hypothetical protein n=1 Tax=Salipaludibacillus keqinensis TaxID=2045207 RepID=UPI001304F82F|nr:hypothetical protein [Salipaludibacillus keqinensis]
MIRLFKRRKEDRTTIYSSSTKRQDCERMKRIAVDEEEVHRTIRRMPLGWFITTASCSPKREGDFSNKGFSIDEIKLTNRKRLS